MKRVYIFTDHETGRSSAFIALTDLCSSTGHTYAAAKKGLERTHLHRFRNGDTVQRSDLYPSKGKIRSGRAAMEAMNR